MAEYLLDQGVVVARLETVGFGEGSPLADNATAEGRSLNRRVDLSLVPITEASLQ